MGITYFKYLSVTCIFQSPCSIDMVCPFADKDTGTAEDGELTKLQSLSCELVFEVNGSIGVVER